MMSDRFESTLSHYAADTIASTLAPFINPQRLARIHDVLAQRTDHVQLAIENPSDPHNALAAVRTSEALGIATIHIISEDFDRLAIRTVTQGAYYWVELIHHATLDDFLAHMQSQPHQLLGAVVSEGTPLPAIGVAQPMCLMLGNESVGLSKAAQAACDGHYTIPMTGMTESLNLSVAAAISLYDTTQRIRQQSARSPLSEALAQRLRARYYMKSVNIQLLHCHFPIP